MDELIQYLNYDPELGIFTWKIEGITKSRRYPVKIGQRAGVWGKDGYRFVNFKNKRYPEHRLIWYYVHGVLPRYIDHKNGIVDDNRLCNLRECSNAENGANRVGDRGKQKYKGVFFKKSKKVNQWEVALHVMYKYIYIGQYPTPELAALAYNKAAIKYFGEFAKLNIINNE